jgi:hypothetical protein
MNFTIEQMVAILAALNVNSSSSAPQTPRKVIVRSRDAGVLYGEYVSHDASSVTLKNAIQMWKWHAAEGFTLIDVAMNGVKKSECKFSTSAANVIVVNPCAIIDVALAATKSIEEA